MRCKSCGEEEETTEHLLKYRKYRKILTGYGIEPKELKTQNKAKLKQIKDHITAVEKIKKENNW